MQRDCTSACAVACLHPRSSISNVVASVTIHDNKYTYMYKYFYISRYVKVYEYVYVQVYAYVHVFVYVYMP